MPDLWMDVDAALSEVPVNLLPLLDDTDFKTRETAVAYNAAGMDLVWNFVTTAGAFTQTAVTPTSGGSYDWTHQGDGIYTIEIPASGGASINNDTEGFGWFTGVATGVLPWRGPVIGFRATGLNNLLIDDAYSATRGLAGTALPAAAADAAGGLIISDAGGLDADAQRSDVAAILVDTGTTLQGEVDGIQADTEDIQSRLPAALVSGRMDSSIGAVASGVIAAASFAVGALDAVWSTATRLLTAGTNIVLAKGTGVTGLNDLDAAGVRTAVGLTSANLDTQLDALPTAAENADAVWDEAIAGHAGAGSTGEALSNATAPTAAAVADAVWEEAIADHSGTAGSTAEALNAAGSAGDPWVTALPGAYGAGSAGKIVGDALDAAVSSRASQASLDAVDDYVDTEVAAIKAKTDNLPASPAATGDIPSAAAIASQVRTELTTELGRVDVAVSTRLATAGYTAPLDAAGTRTAVGLASANLDTQLDALPTAAENASAVAAQVTTDHGAGSYIRNTEPLDAAGTRTALGLASANLDTQLAAIDDYLDTEIAAIKAVTDQLTAAQAEPTAVPAANASPLAKIAWMAALARNAVEQTATTQSLKNNAGSGDIATAAVSDDGSTFVRSQWA